MVRLWVLGALVVAVMVGMSLLAGWRTHSASVVAQPIATATPTSNPNSDTEIAVLRARIDELGRSQDKALQTITIITAASGIVATLIVAGATALVVTNVFQGNKTLERDREHLEKLLREDFEESLARTRADLQQEYGERVDEAVGTLEHRLQELTTNRFTEQDQRVTQAMSKVGEENGRLAGAIREALFEVRENHIRVLMAQTGMRRATLKEHEPYPRPDDVLAAIMNLIDSDPHPSYSQARDKGFYYLESFLTEPQVALSPQERQSLQTLLERHKSNLSAQRLDDLQRWINATAAN